MDHIIKSFIIVALFTIPYLIIRHYYTRKKNLYIWFATDYILKLYNGKQRTINVPIDEYSTIIIPTDNIKPLGLDSIQIYFFFKGLNVDSASIYLRHLNSSTYVEFFDKPYRKIIETKMKNLYMEEREDIRNEKHEQTLRIEKQKANYNKTYNNKSR